MRSVVPIPDVAGPADSIALDMSVIGRELREVDGSYLTNRNVPGPPEVYVWARYREAPFEQYLHQVLAAQMTTHWTIAAAMRPHDGVTEADADHTVSTGPLSVSIAFHDGIDVTQWMLYCNTAIHAGAGSVHGDGRVYSIGGRMLASYIVQAMVRPFTAPSDTLGGTRQPM